MPKEFSKKLLVASYIIAILVTIATFTLPIITYTVSGQLMDYSSLMPVTLACWGEVTVGNSFYYWKAKSENKIKLLAEADRGKVSKELVEQIKSILTNEML